MGGGTSAVIGGHALHEPIPVPPPSLKDIAAAGAGITAEAPPPAATPTQGELPLGPPQVLTPAQQVASAAAIVNYAGKIATGELSHPDDGVAEPMMVPEGARGRSIGDAVNSEILASGPLETRPSTINISPDMIPEATPRVGEAAPQLSVALKAGTAKVSNVLEGKKLLGQVVNLAATQTKPTISLNTLHSTTLGNILPHVSMGQQGSVMRALS